jgi:formylglycine-generating enzyme required for sulfatase activity
MTTGNAGSECAGKRATMRWSRNIVMLLAAALACGATFASEEDRTGVSGRCGVAATPAGMVVVPAGVYRPLFRGESEAKEVPVAAFYLDAHPVTNGEFLEFVRANPRWRRSQVKRLFADENYLRHWADDLDLGEEAVHVARQPVTWVSWFAAKAYAVWAGKRLPLTAEWELAAAAGFSHANGANDVEFVRAITCWYSTPAPAVLPPVGSGRANFLGVHDLHGLVWEWTSDFNSALVTGDARGDTGLERQLFCGSGSLGASDRADYPAFMRFGFRSGLKAGYTVHNLGFRCAKDS